jgi:hypothetical protein
VSGQGHKENMMGFRSNTVQVERALFNTQMFNFLALEVLAVSIFVGVTFQSLGWGLVAFLVLMIGIWRQPFQSLIAILFTLSWSVIAGWIGYTLSHHDGFSCGVAAIAGLMIAAGVHTAAIQWQKDFISE